MSLSLNKTQDFYGNICNYFMNNYIEILHAIFLKEKMYMNIQ